jgi:hypothetical protein
VIGWKLTKGCQPSDANCAPRKRDMGLCSRGRHPPRRGQGLSLSVDRQQLMPKCPPSTAPISGVLPSLSFTSTSMPLSRSSFANSALPSRAATTSTVPAESILEARAAHRIDNYPPGSGFKLLSALRQFCRQKKGETNSFYPPKGSGIDKLRSSRTC